MPRIRQLKHGFFLDEDLAEVSPWARLLFAGLWVLADRDGRLEDRPPWIRVQVFPYDDLEAAHVSVGGMLDELARPRKHSGGAFITRYTVDGKHYIQVNNFAKHQKPHPKEADSEIPAAPAVASREKVRSSRVISRLSREKDVPSREKDSTSRVVSGSGNGIGNGSGNGGSGAGAPAPHGPPVDGDQPPQAATPEEAREVAVAKLGPPPWNHDAWAVWEDRFGQGSCTKAVAVRINTLFPPILRAHGGWESVREVWRWYVNRTDVTKVSFLTPEDFVQRFAEWAAAAQGGNGAALARAGPGPPRAATAGEKTVAAVGRFIQRKAGGG